MYACVCGIPLLSRCDTNPSRLPPLSVLLTQPPLTRCACYIHHHHHHPQTSHPSFISSSLTAITRSPTRLMILETEESAVRRGASKVYGELAGYGATCDAHHITAPAPGGKGLARACEIALKER
eukprot:GHVU01060063.1.p2 GENE.GHVU01060063.1~~GHVU01060063.1.p2  ORF type:complete len:124 (-),score=10.26 GHVU01060063.1:3-374(-)